MNPISASFPAIKRVNANESSLSAKTHFIGSGSTIGTILVDAGRLSAENAERILRLQAEQGGHFGEIAINLGLLTEEDVRFTLSRQFNNLHLPEGDSSLSNQLVAAYKPFSAIVEKLRGLRSQLMLRWFDDIGRNALAIVSPGAGEGRSFIAANLAIVFTQLGKSTLLIDADLRTPRQHYLFKLNNNIGLSSLLAGRTSKEVVARVPPLLNLSVLPAGAVPPNPQELLGRSTFGALLQTFISEFDVVIIDTPAANEYADTQIIAAHASAALILARKDRTSMPHTINLARNLQHTGTTTVGTVLNDF